MNEDGSDNDNDITSIIILSVMCFVLTIMLILQIYFFTKFQERQKLLKIAYADPKNTLHIRFVRFGYEII